MGEVESLEEHREVPISEVSQRLGVPMPTLRSWELRYGIPGTTRESGKHRRYSPAELHALRLMRDEIARGTRAGAAARAVKASLRQSGPAAGLVTAVLKASDQHDAVAIRNQLDAATRELGLLGCLDDVLFPALRQVGVWWQVGRCDIEQERLTTEAVRAWLDRLTSYAPNPTHPRPIVLACGPGDVHSVGLEALCLSLRQERWSCRLLGARTAPIALTTAVLANRAVAVVVASHLASARQRAVTALQDVAGLGVEVFYAGNAFATPRSRSKVPGTYLGPRLAGATERIVTALESRARAERT
jgi:DNA-binding transcriptional MerR regulator